MAQADPKTLNGYPVIAFDRHPNCLTVMVDRGVGAHERFVVATWWPELRNGWSWGHYCQNMAEANGAMREVSTRNAGR